MHFLLYNITHMHGNKPSRKKVPFAISDQLMQYLIRYGRVTQLPLQYDDMTRYIASYSLLNSKGEDTFWETVFYTEYDQQIIHDALCLIYALL